MKSTSLFSVVLGAGLALACTVSSASAVAILPTDKLIVYDSWGTPVFSVFTDEIAEAANPSAIYVILEPFLADSSQLGNATLLTEGGLYSDVFGVVRLTLDECRAIDPNFQQVDSITQYDFLAFNSGDITSPPSAFGTPQHSFEESTGSPPGTFDATMYLSLAKRQAGFTATFFSDVEPSNNVPEGGATLGLFVLALAGMGLGHKKMQLGRA